ncbi:hypothetical protein F5Y05DRAFT_231703 [Hypoxylon sp. FL0543]|nr:hypothetical protein F5Y05DRAFT_231703 [Hypoxylon sp. FL0543]
MSVSANIKALQAEATQILCQRAPTHAEYAAALELADAALELAVNGRASRRTIESCESFQRFCYDSLHRSYSRAENYERDVYERRASSQAAARSRRRGRVYDTDPGEHLLEAFEAVRIGKILDDQQAAAAEGLNRRIRWVDEVANMPIESVRTLSDIDATSLGLVH